MSNHRELIEEAVKAVGSQAKLAEAIGLTQQGVWWLIHRGDKVSAEVAVAVEKATAGKVTRQQLRPDLFGEAAA